MDVVDTCLKAGATEKTCDGCHKKFGGMRHLQLSEMKSLKNEESRLKKIVAELELDKLTLN